jgi:hypothetical protein
VFPGQIRGDRVPKIRENDHEIGVQVPSPAFTTQTAARPPIGATNARDVEKPRLPVAACRPAVRLRTRVVTKIEQREPPNVGERCALRRISFFRWPGHLVH